MGLIDEYEFIVQPVLAGHGPTLLVGLRERIELELVDRHELRSGAVAVRYRPCASDGFDAVVLERSGPLARRSLLVHGAVGITRVA
jgi:hypothetical protein